MCDIWRANANGIELSRDDLAPHVAAMTRLRVRMLVLTGGEALMHSNLWTLCDALRPIGAKIVLLSTGLLLKRHVSSIISYCDEVIVSLDGSAAVHDEIRNIPRAFLRLAEGVEAILTKKPDFDIHARSVVQRKNYRDILNTIESARALGLRKISFLAADVSSDAFNRPGGWDADRISEIALTSAEADDFSRQLSANKDYLMAQHASGFLVEPVSKLTAIADYYRALNGNGRFPTVRCNAPWVSAVVETDGAIRPCFFHPAFGNLADGDIEQSINSDKAVSFRRSLDVSSNPICQKCTCSLNL
jgi:MoaA/NifB/PqqE/SkfB family radical SAM enzyme